jgi:hypothetical protein
MLSPQEMQSKAARCDEMAQKAIDRSNADTFRDLARQWRVMASQLEGLEYTQIVQTLRTERAGHGCTPRERRTLGFRLVTRPRQV